MSLIEADSMTAEVVAGYLRDHPDFFLSRRDLVDRLALPNHQQGAVSLVEVQLRRQRQRIEELEEEITTLMSLAANNDKTFYEFMDLQEQVLKCSSFSAVVMAIESMASELGLCAYIRLLDHDDDAIALPGDGWKRFSTNHLNGKSAYLGRLRKVDRESLMGEQYAPEMGSYVVMPLMQQTLLGFLAFSSEDGGHFQPNMDTLFLRHLALVVAHLAETLPWQSSVTHDCIQSTSA
ncbi:3',5'-cyclic-nucleotide phosphodiesterase [Vibrio sp. 10N.286.49.B3]|uniref:DUF484 family protein n=1 Tax=Vibrio sp. 10N.286.49.B3 TaxID=1880855 RepID=UPI000C83B5BB|nr:DUF484 family protein [Vibrio sp. 10N.286.49.B3]PMH45452.1 3',5'-cyclic-nucleotide phosphodiesterase [Vibrio sp. 10N.286.49.B3]